MECRRGLAMRILSVCPSVRPFVCQMRELRQNGRKNLFRFLYGTQDHFSLVFWEEEWLVDGDPSFSSSSFSSPANSTHATSSVIFQSCKFHPPFFDGPSFSTPANSSHPAELYNTIPTKYQWKINPVKSHLAWRETTRQKMNCFQVSDINAYDGWRQVRCFRLHLWTSCLQWIHLHLQLSEMLLPHLVFFSRLHTHMHTHADVVNTALSKPRTFCAQVWQNYTTLKITINFILFYLSSRQYSITLGLF